MIKRGEIVIRPEESCFDKWARRLNVTIVIVSSILSVIVLINQWMHMDQRIEAEMQEYKEPTYRLMKQYDPQMPTLTLEDGSKRHDHPITSAVAFVNRTSKLAFTVTCCGSYELELASGDYLPNFEPPRPDEVTYTVDFNTGETSGDPKLATRFVVRGQAEILTGRTEGADQFVAGLMIDGFKLLGRVNYLRSEEPTVVNGTAAIGPNRFKRLVIIDPHTSIAFGDAMGQSMNTIHIYEFQPPKNLTAKPPNPPAEQPVKGARVGRVRSVEVP